MENKNDSMQIGVFFSNDSSEEDFFNNMVLQVHGKKKKDGN